ncbi:MAG: permease [Armatimonadota bacterium]|nr:permease [Armatimonadota bacterium]
MDTFTLGFVAATLGLLAVTWWVGGPRTAVQGIGGGLQLFLQILPRMLLAFVLAGLIQVLVPNQTIARYLSDASGFRGIVAASVAGTFTPGGPFFMFPVVAALFKMGAGIGPLVAYLTAWSLLGAYRVVLWELPFLGPRITFVRVLVSLPMPLIAGAAARYFVEYFRVPPPP